jgi:hypothetical protein
VSTTRPAAPAFFRPDRDTGHVIERDTERDADREVHPARLTVDLLRPVAMAPLHYPVDGGPPRAAAVARRRRTPAGWQQDGPKSVWVREVTPLIDGVELNPFVRAAIAGDYASSLTNFGSIGLRFINADYTVSLSRLPDGPHLGLAALTHHACDGVSTGVATLFDHRGPIGNATVTALVNPGFMPGLSGAAG